MTTTVYVSIGNSDDKLSQAKWAHFVEEVRQTLRADATWVHGEWFSAGDSPWQNACWCVELPAEHIGTVRSSLRRLAGLYSQDSIAWAECPTTEFLSPVGA